MTIDLADVDTIGKMREFSERCYESCHRDGVDAKLRIKTMANQLEDMDVDNIDRDLIASLLTDMQLVSGDLWRIWWSILPREKSEGGQ